MGEEAKTNEILPRPANAQDGEQLGEAADKVGREADIGRRVRQAVLEYVPLQDAESHGQQQLVTAEEHYHYC